MRSASMCSATSRSSAGTVNRYCVRLSRVLALKLPPMTPPMLASCSADRPGLPRNIMCSCACAMPGKPAGGLVRAHQIVDRGRDHRGERVAHDDDAQPVRERRAQHILVGSGRDRSCSYGRGRGATRAREQQRGTAGQQLTGEIQRGELHGVPGIKSRWQRIMTIPGADSHPIGGRRVTATGSGTDSAVSQSDRRWPRSYFGRYVWASS